MTQYTILLLEDDDDFRALLRAHLESVGYDVHEARKGAVACQKLQDLEPDLVIVDGLLPDCTGAQWIEEVRKEGTDVELIFLSAFFKRDNRLYRTLTDEHGVAAVLFKPVNFEKLLTAIHLTLEGGRSLSTAVPHGSSASRPAPRRSKASASSKSSKTILLLDDDSDLRTLLRAHLEHVGYEVVEAGSGAEASDHVEGGDIDLVVVDGLLPDTSGLTWIATLRATSSVPIVFLSGFYKENFNLSPSMASSLHVASALFKPVEPEALVKAVASALEDAGSA